MKIDKNGGRRDRYCGIRENRTLTSAPDYSLVYFRLGQPSIEVFSSPKGGAAVEPLIDCVLGWSTVPYLVPDVDRQLLLRSETPPPPAVVVALWL